MLSWSFDIQSEIVAEWHALVICALASLSLCVLEKGIHAAAGSSSSQTCAGLSATHMRASQANKLFFVCLSCVRVAGAGRLVSAPPFVSCSSTRKAVHEGACAPPRTSACTACAGTQLHRSALCFLRIASPCRFTSSGIIFLVNNIVRVFCIACRARVARRSFSAPN